MRACRVFHGFLNTMLKYFLSDGVHSCGGCPVDKHKVASQASEAIALKFCAWADCKPKENVMSARVAAIRFDFMG